MEKLAIIGGKRLGGEVEISGAKNAAVAIIPASLLVSGICRVDNLPDIKDVNLMLEVLEDFGARINRTSPGSVEIDASNVRCAIPPYDKVSRMRASYYLLGALIGRFYQAEVPMPGGCNFGARPIDQHLKGLRALSVSAEVSHGMVKAYAERTIGASVYLDVVSVGATINIMLAATLAEGTTHIENAAKEPHVVDVANFLNSMGANIKGAGTDIIRIVGVPRMEGGSYSIIPDQIEAGTFMIAAAATDGNVLVKNVIPKHLEPVSAKLVEIGASVDEFDDSIRVKGSRELKGTNIKTQPYPGFPTDLQPQMVALLSVSKGVSMITESVWDNRFQYIDEIKKMGANIKTDGHSAVIQGVSHLTGAPVKVTDLRAGAALAVAGLVAKGVTEMCDIQHIDRGYSHFEDKLRALGAQITRLGEHEGEFKIIQNRKKIVTSAG
ncbi:MAG: UDP-N-acetylglucosamine 1-carboxyvinyltransferase [Clostridiales bacterium]|nr:UDP-N-acetylglucosamine 1-carboxyvinyltransferase [Clostridiales bacterium]